MTTVVLGCGNVGSAFARRWRAGYPDSALRCTVHRETSRDRLAGIDADIEVVDLLDAEQLAGVLRGANQVLFSAAPRRQDRGDLLWSDGMRNLVSALDCEFAPHVVHVSSTGVYAEDGGGGVDEDAALARGPHAQAMIAAESVLGGATGVRSTILRCAGLVGPGRGPQRGLERLAGSARPGGDGWLNLVWIDDVAKVIERAFERGLTGVYNLSGTSMRRREFYDPLLSRAGLEPVQWQTDPPRLGRRVLVDRFSRTFGMDLKTVDPLDLGEA